MLLNNDDIITDHDKSKNTCQKKKKEMDGHSSFPGRIPARDPADDFELEGDSPRPAPSSAAPSSPAPPMSKVEKESLFIMIFGGVMFSYAALVLLIVLIARVAYADDSTSSSQTIHAILSSALLGTCGLAMLLRSETLAQWRQDLDPKRSQFLTVNLVVVTCLVLGIELCASIGWGVGTYLCDGLIGLFVVFHAMLWYWMRRRSGDKRRQIILDDA
jgi:hypothetical protein